MNSTEEHLCEYPNCHMVGTTRVYDYLLCRFHRKEFKEFVEFMEAGRQAVS